MNYLLNNEKAINELKEILKIRYKELINIRLETLAQRRINDDMASAKISAAEKAQTAIDEFWADNEINVADLEAMIEGHK